MLNRFLCDCRGLVCCVLLLGGCNGGAAGVSAPKFDPAGATESALAEYDSNGDRKLSKEELQKCPGLLSAIGLFDQDGDGSLSDIELTSNLQGFHNEGASLIAVSCAVTSNNQPLEGATVTLVPEAFMGEALKPATGITTRTGGVGLSVADDEIPAEYRGRINGVHCGIFRVVVTHPTVNVPAKYNTQTELGRVVSRRNNETLIVNF